jgi:hypothetical protein
MNPRRVHDLMHKNFPIFDSAKVEWINVVEREGPDVQRLESLLEQFIGASEVLVEVHRTVGGQFATKEAAAFICSHIGKGQIRVADRKFTSFVVVAQNGVMTGWHSVIQQQSTVP